LLERFLDQRNHRVLVEVAATDMRIMPIAHFQLLPSLSGGDWDAGSLKPVDMVHAKDRIDDVKRSLAVLDPFRNERKQEGILFVAGLKERAHMVVRSHCRTTEPYRPPWIVHTTSGAALDGISKSGSLSTEEVALGDSADDKPLRPDRKSTIAESFCCGNEISVLHRILVATEALDLRLRGRSGGRSAMIFEKLCEAPAGRLSLFGWRESPASRCVT